MNDAHYGGDLVDGASVLGLFGDAATLLLLEEDGDEGLFRAYSMVEFLAPVKKGDFVEVRAEITKKGKTSRAMNFEAWKIAVPRTDISASAGDFLTQPVLAVKASGTCVTPLECQRR